MDLCDVYLMVFGVSFTVFYSVELESFLSHTFRRKKVSCWSSDFCDQVISTFRNVSGVAKL